LKHGEAGDCEDASNWIERWEAMTMEKKRVVLNPAADEGKKAGDNDDGVNADELLGTEHSDYSSEQDDSMLSDDAG
jgi:hypothetical protein